MQSNKQNFEHTTSPTVIYLLIVDDLCSLVGCLAGHTDDVVTGALDALVDVVRMWVRVVVKAEHLHSDRHRCVCVWCFVYLMCEGLPSFSRVNKGFAPVTR